MSRWYYRFIGTALAIAGGYVLFEGRDAYLWPALGLIIAGLSALALSFVRRGDRVADVARAEMEIGSE